MPRRALIASLFAVLVVLVAGCGGGTSSGGDDPASAVPRDAAMYFEATIRPEGQQRDDALAAAGKVLATPDPQAKIESLIHVALVSHHLIEFTRDCVQGLGESSFYAPGAMRPVRAPEAPTAAAV